MTRRHKLTTLSLAAVLALLAPVGCRSNRAPGESATVRAEPLTEAQRAARLADVDYAAKRVEATYFRPDRLDPEKDGLDAPADWATAKANARAAVAEAKTVGQARAAVVGLLKWLGESHFAVIPAEAYVGGGDVSSTQPATREADAAFGLDARLVGGRATVVAVRPETPAARTNVKPGWRITRVAGKPTRPIEKLHAEGGEGKLVAGALLRNLDEAPAGTQQAFGFEDEAGKPREVTLTAEQPAGGAPPVAFGNLPPIRVDVDQRTLPNGVGYFKLSIFFEPGRVIDQFEAFVVEHAKAPGLVIDLRGNPGGIGGMAMGMGSYLVEGDASLGTMTMRGATLRFVLNPQLDAYTRGPVAVLVDELSASTSEILADGLQALGRARVFGETTAGAALPSQIERLPSGDRLQFAVADYVSADGERLEARGVVPDEAVPYRRADLLAGRDAQLDAAVKWIERTAATRPAATTAPFTADARR